MLASVHVSVIFQKPRDIQTFILSSSEFQKHFESDEPTSKSVHKKIHIAHLKGLFKLMILFCDKFEGNHYISILLIIALLVMQSISTLQKVWEIVFVQRFEVSDCDL